MKKEYIPLMHSDLVSGRYNILLGSGASLECENIKGSKMKSAEKLREKLCALKGVGPQTPLTRLYSNLSASEIKNEITDEYTTNLPDENLGVISRFSWKRIFTLNVDDAIEKTYERMDNAYQKLQVINYNRNYEDPEDKAHLQIIHLHGFVGDARSGYIFSTADYAKSIRKTNPWMHVLSEKIASEAFIIAGTSLNEVDLEYYLSARSKTSPKRGRGPSFWIDPNPDPITESDCAKHGLILVKARLHEFLSWIRTEIPNIPTISEQLVPSDSDIFGTQPSQGDKLRFFSDFEIVVGMDESLPKDPTSFFFGAEPTWKELNSHADIERESAAQIYSAVGSLLSASSDVKFIWITDDAGEGKSTVIKRIASDFSKSGKIVLSNKSTGKFNLESAIECLSRIKSKCVLLIDNIADHASQVSGLFSDRAVYEKIFVIGADREYRSEYVKVHLSAFPSRVFRVGGVNKSEALQLIERYRQFGIIGHHKAIYKPEQFASSLLNDPIAVCVCRILNNFKPLSQILESLWDEATPANKYVYLFVAVARLCISSGVKSSIVQSCLESGQNISDFIETNIPLRLIENQRDDDFLLPYNQTISSQIVLLASKKQRELLFTVFKDLAHGIAPYVNRETLKRRLPEAQLAGRLFDIDKIVSPLLKENTRRFFEEVKDEWEWNSRYWEQRSLLILRDDLETSIQYARHAVSIEDHPYPLTTLSKVLTEKLKRTDSGIEIIYDEIYRNIFKAISIERQKSRVTIPPILALFSATHIFLSKGGILKGEQEESIRDRIRQARSNFAHDRDLNNLIDDFLRKTKPFLDFFPQQ